MAIQPSEDEIAMLCAIVDIDRSEAIERLKNNNNNVDQAINEYYDNPDSARNYVWDETQFSSERDGTASNAGNSFNVQGPDEHVHDPAYLTGLYPGAPSRPPSRTDSRSPLGGRLMSLQKEHAAANTLNSLSSDDNVIKEVMERSAWEAGIAPQQYGHINETEEVQFGPATRESYDTGQWAMVLGASANEDLLDPEPMDRKREEGIPAFLKSDVENHRLGALITIYHEIPLAREVFLDRENLLPDFGHNSKWWTGQTIQQSERGIADDDIHPRDSAVSHELQRLMAFLDNTERSYGSAGALAELSGTKRVGSSENLVFLSWEAAHQESPELLSIFSKGIEPRGLNAEPQTYQFAMLEVFLSAPPDSENMQTLYDLADEALWLNSGPDMESSAYITRIGEVLTFKVSGYDSTKSVGVIVPAIWYPDRYLESAREASFDMRLKKLALNEEIENLARLESSLTYFPWKGKTILVKDLFEASSMHDMDEVPPTSINGLESPSDDSEMVREPRAIDKMNISTELRKVMASIDKKLLSLEIEKEKARASLLELSKLYTEPSEDPKLSPTNPYTLCGVSITKDITYVRRTVEPDLIEMTLDSTDLDKDTDQWWKITSGTSTPSGVTVEKVTQDMVLQATVKNNQFPLFLVYASEKAMSAPRQSLPEVLQAFVRADNLSFSAEFPDVLESQSVTTPTSPNKRKYDYSSEQSQDPPIRYIGPSAMGWGDDFGGKKNEDVRITHRELSSSGNSDAAAEQSLSSPPAYVFQDDTIMDQASGEVTNGTAFQMSTKEEIPSLMPSLMDGPVPHDGMDVDDLTGGIDSK